MGEAEIVSLDLFSISLNKLQLTLHSQSWKRSRRPSQMTTSQQTRDSVPLKHRRRSENISCLLRSIIFFETKASQTQWLLRWWLCSPKHFRHTRKCVCVLIFISFLENEMLRHDPASSVSPISDKWSNFKSTELYRVVQSCTELYRVIQSCTELYRVLQSCTELYRVVQHSTVVWYSCRQHCHGFYLYLQELMFDHLANRDHFLHKKAWLARST